MVRVLRLFEVLAALPEGLSLSDISARLGAPKSTLLNSLRPLVSDGFLHTEGTLYRLGPRAFRLAAEISSSWSLSQLMRGYLRELAEQADETALLSILDEKARRFVHIDAIESRNRVRYVMTIGSGGSLYAAASGRALLAFQPQDYQDDYIANVELIPFTAQTTVDRDMLRAQLAEVRRTRCWVSVGEIDPDGGAIASPIFGPKGDVVAAIGVALPLTRMRGREQFLRDIVISVAAHASGEARSENEGTPGD
jgi:DNA-binding IclR family transcriptional regulator